MLALENVADVAAVAPVEPVVVQHVEVDVGFVRVAGWYAGGEEAEVPLFFWLVSCGERGGGGGRYSSRTEGFALCGGRRAGCEEEGEGWEEFEVHGVWAWAWLVVEICSMYKGNR